VADASTSDLDEVRAADGRVPGRRGIATRGRLLEQTAKLLATTRYRDVKVIDIARDAGTSPATFYQYFADVEQAVLALAEELAPDAAALNDLVRGSWRGDRGLETARRVVEGFLDYYERHRAVFRVVDLATEEGDLRFQRLRTRALSGISEVLDETIAGFQREGKVPADVDSTATAYMLVSMLAHAAAHRYGMEFFGVRTARQVDAMTRILFITVTGRRMPASRTP
jgi:AcrR family transcriptional regulator